jgi:hypothetical protein
MPALLAVVIIIGVVSVLVVVIAVVVRLCVPSLVVATKGWAAKERS